MNMKTCAGCGREVDMDVISVRDHIAEFHPELLEAYDSFFGDEK